MKQKILGLDIGIASVGHAIINYDDKNFDGEIIEAGARVFDACEVAKTKEPLNAQRRNFRLARRRLARRSSRLRQLKQLFISNNLLNEAQINNMFQGSKNRIDVWELRKEALNRKLTVEELYRVIHQIAKRRGFKSIRKSEEAKREGALLKSLSKNVEAFKDSNFQTIGEMFATIFVDKAKRNKRDMYTNSIPRYLLVDELNIIFDKQRDFGLDIATEEFQKQIFEKIFAQNSIQSMEKMVGYCQFEKDEKRAPKAAYTSEIFVAVQKILNTHVIDEVGQEYEFDEEHIKRILELAHEQSKVTYKQVKKEFSLSDETRFKGLNYNKKIIDKKTKEEKIVNPEESAFVELKKYQEFKKAIIKNTSKEYFENIKDVQTLFDNIAEVLTYEKSDDTIVQSMKEKEIPDEIINAVKDLSAVKVMHLSIKAMKKIIPFMIQGNRYNVACELAGYDFKNEKESKGEDFLPVLKQEELTTNPVVNRSISQTRKVVNALIRKYGKFDKIIIETARDLGKSAEERNKIKAGQNEFKEQKDKARERCIEHGINPDSKNNLLKYRLWEQQGGKCVYSWKEDNGVIKPVEIDIERLAEPNYADIDHILPYSRSFDDSLNNKVLCLSDENRQKGNKTPYEYLGNKVDWYKYSQYIRSLNLNSAKTNRILRQEYHGNTDTFISRNLNDTRYMTVFIKDYIKSNLDCKVETRNGSLTAFLRNQWGIIKNRDTDKHHAIDAVVLACSTQGMVKYLSTVSAKREKMEREGNAKPRFSKPWATFDEDLTKIKDNIFVSRALVTKIPGSIHKATLKSPKHLAEGFTTLKTDIQSLSLSKLETMYDKERNIAVYNVLKERLEQFGGDGKKAFAEPVYMPLSKEKEKAGQKPHEIKSIKLVDNSVSGVLLPQGFADNDSMARVDVFSKKNSKGKDEFYLVPIYVADFAKGILPNKVIKANQLESEWIIIDDTFKFKFSLFSNTLISINKTGKKEDEIFGYYIRTHRCTGSIYYEMVDGKINENGEHVQKTIGVKTLKTFKKYQVDVLGNYHEIKKEKRQPIHFRGDKNK